METLDFLVELGTEELPPKALPALSKAFVQGIESGLKDARLAFIETQAFAAQRRLAVLVKGLETQQADQALEKLGPAVKAAFDKDNNPTPAATGFAKGCGVDVSALETVATDKGDRLVWRTQEKGAPTRELLPEIVSASLQGLPIPKRMRWGASRTEFVRPVHWLVMLLGEEVVPAQVLGLSSGRTSQGHRFHGKPVEITSPATYEEQLLAEKVITCFARRQEKISALVAELAKKINGEPLINPALLNEVTALVEWPVPLAGSFEERFLSVPQEALIASMEEHQKYFPVTDGKGALLPLFITVSNIESQDPQTVIQGNERVIRPRLADAAFFFETDKKTPLANRLPKLSTILFQKELGTLEDKSQRIASLAKTIATDIGADPELASRAGLLAKADLVSDMVFEFDSMQGLAGRYYAANDGEAPEVAEAIEEHYFPKQAGSPVPTAPIAIAVAIADRLDTLSGIFGIGQKPTGSKDPFALRRASLGVLRIMLENQIDLDLKPLLAKACEQHPKLTQENTEKQVLTYMMERFKAWYADQSIPAEAFLSVDAQGISNPLDFNQRVQAVNTFLQMSEAPTLAQANKRVVNILEKAEGFSPSAVQADLLEVAEEQALVSAIAELESIVAPLTSNREYTEALQKLASLQPQVDAFFEGVMVMVDNEALKTNRLNILASLRQLFLQIADISFLVPAK